MVPTSARLSVLVSRRILSTPRCVSLDLRLDHVLVVLGVCLVLPLCPGLSSSWVLGFLGRSRVSFPCHGGSLVMIRILAQTCSCFGCRFLLALFTLLPVLFSTSTLPLPPALISLHFMLPLSISPFVFPFLISRIVMNFLRTPLFLISRPVEGYVYGAHIGHTRTHRHQPQPHQQPQPRSTTAAAAAAAPTRPPAPQSKLKLAHAALESAPTPHGTQRPVPTFIAPGSEPQSHDPMIATFTGVLMAQESRGCEKLTRGYVLLRKPWGSLREFGPTIRLGPCGSLDPYTFLGLR